jgi:hypothetical protein
MAFGVHGVTDPSKMGSEHFWSFYFMLPGWTPWELGLGCFLTSFLSGHFQTETHPLIPSVSQAPSDFSLSNTITTYSSPLWCRDTALLQLSSSN